MKKTTVSFLFFFIIILCSTLFSFAQNKSDSLQYFRKIALQPQSANDLHKAQNYFNTKYVNAKEKRDIGLSTYALYYIASIESKKR